MSNTNMKGNNISDDGIGDEDFYGGALTDDDAADEVVQLRRALEAQIGDRERWDRAMSQAANDAAQRGL